MNDITFVNPRPYWTTGATLLWSIIILAAFVAGQLIMGLGAGIDWSVYDPNDIQSLLPTLETNGPFVAWSAIGGALFGIPVCLALIKLKKGSSIRDYLALNPFTWRQGLKWLLIMAVAVLVLSIIGDRLGEQSADAFANGIYESSTNLPLLFIGVAILAPVFEEVFFRGFLYKGLAEGKLGPINTIVLTSAVWASIHLQYGWFPILMIFIMGIILGLARYKTNSLWLPIALHVLNNALAFAQPALSGSAS